jgi:hypothetical protein
MSLGTSSSASQSGHLAWLLGLIIAFHFWNTSLWALIFIKYCDFYVTIYHLFVLFDIFGILTFLIKLAFQYHFRICLNLQKKDKDFFDEVCLAAFLRADFAGEVA